jgi:hypothetical protein
MVTQLIALSPITTAGARDQEQSESYNSDDGDEPILHD